MHTTTSFAHEVAELADQATRASLENASRPLPVTGERITLPMLPPSMDFERLSRLEPTSKEEIERICAGILALTKANMNTHQYRVWDTQFQVWVTWGISLLPDGKLYELGQDAYIEVDPDRYIVEFATGHLDTHTRMIYEGDVLRIVFPEYASKENDIGWVVWDNSEGMWDVQSFSWWCAIGQPHQSEREVLGNIHEHPHLLTKEQPAK